MTDALRATKAESERPTVEVSQSPVVVEMKGVSFSYDGLTVLEDVDLEVRGGEFLSVVGPNGGGKTTLVKLILGLLRPSSGIIRVLGRTPREARRFVGYLPQYVHFDPLFPITVRDVVLMGRLGPSYSGRYTKADRAAARRAMESVCVDNLQDRAIQALSGGQRQRVLLARALATEPQLLLLDEPTANVDSAVEEQLFDTLRMLNRHMTILIVSHDLGVVSQVVSSVICVRRTVRVHPTSEFTGDLVRELYGGGMRMVHHDHCREGGGGSDE